MTAAMVLVATPVIAQASATSELTNQLNGELLYIVIPIAVLVEVTLLHTVIRFRNSEHVLPIEESRQLKITRTIATAIILLLVGAASYGALTNGDVTYQGNNIAMDNDPIVVTTKARQWGWSIYYPEEDNFSSGSKIVTPKNRPIYFQATLTDVIYGLRVPELALKQDAIPGSTSTIKTIAYKEDTCQGYCTERCGVVHSQMYFTVDVISQSEYRSWPDEQQSIDSESSDSSSSTTTNFTQ